MIGLCPFDIEFHVLDIAPAYYYLLGWPWMHYNSAIPFSLHQKVKFIIDDKLVSISGEEDIIAMTLIEPLYIEVNADAQECSFKAFEIVNAIFVLKDL